MDVAEKNRPDISQTEVENNDNKYNLQVLRFVFKLKTTIIHCSNQVTTQKTDEAIYRLWTAETILFQAKLVLRRLSASLRRT